MCSAFHQGCYALFVCNKIRFGANQRPCLISTELGAPGEDIISSSHSGLVQPNCLKPLELWLRLYVYHLIQILGPNTIHKSSICEISTKWTWNKSRANTTRHVFHRPRGSSFEATSHGLRTETVLGSERMWSQYVAMTNWLSMSQMSQISQGHGDWLVVEAPTERNELFHEDLFPHQRSYSWNMRKLLMSSDVNEITMKISSAWSVSRALCKAVCPSLLRRLTSAPCFRKTLLDATCQTDTIARRFRPNARSSCLKPSLIIAILGDINEKQKTAGSL